MSGSSFWVVFGTVLFAFKMVQIVLARWAVCRKKTKTSFSWAQFLSRQDTLLKVARFNHKKQAKLFNVPPHIAWRMKNNRQLCAMKKRLERFRYSREEHARKQLTLQETLLRQQRAT